jgi:hypothetical protein
MTCLTSMIVLNSLVGPIFIICWGGGGGGWVGGGGLSASDTAVSPIFSGRERGVLHGTASDAKDTVKQ